MASIADCNLPRAFVAHGRLPSTAAIGYTRSSEQVLDYSIIQGDTSMEILLKEAKSILTPQRNGFLAARPYPFTHSLSGYVGCGFGQTTCGLYCYARFLPNWHFSGFTAGWGHAVQVKTNAAQLLAKALSTMKPVARQKLRIFMSSTTDPYQPIERQHQITRQCLEVFFDYPDLDLLVIQTRSPLAARDFSLIEKIPYACLSVSIETDDQAYLKNLKGGPQLEKRWKLVRDARACGIQTQITVSPCLPYSSIEEFGQRLLQSGAHRLIVDSLTDGDGAEGERTARSPFAQVEPGWRDTSHAQRLYNYLREQASGTKISIGWSIAGFCGIAPRHATNELLL
jgi:DNA repair photolyase